MTATLDALLKGASKAQQRALLAMSGEWQFPGRATFTAGAAHNLRWRSTRNPWADSRIHQDGRCAYRLTPLGLELQDRARQLLESPKP